MMHHMACNKCHHEWDTAANAIEIYREACDECGGTSRVLSEIPEWDIRATTQRILKWLRSTTK